MQTNNFSYSKIIVGKAFEIRLKDLQPDYRIKVACMSCSSEGFIDRVVLLTQYKSFERLISIEKKFKCRRCGGNKVCTWQIVKITFGGEDA